MLDKFPGRVYAAIIWAIIVAAACVLYGNLTSCTTIQKFLNKEKQSVDSTTRTKTERIETNEKNTTILGGVVVQLDKGCNNKVSVNAHTGQIEASGGVVGVSVQHEKKEAEKASKSEKIKHKNTYHKDVVTIERQTTKKVIPWWCYALLGVGVLYAAFRIYKSVMLPDFLK